MWPFDRTKSPKWLRRRISMMPERAAIADAFEAAIAARRDRSKDVWYGSQKEHRLGWLAEYDGPGYYGRQTWNVGADRVYNRVVNPAMLVWLAEASGVLGAKVQEAADAALNAEPKMSAQSAAIRKVIPWEHIAVQLS